MTPSAPQPDPTFVPDPKADYLYKAPSQDAPQYGSSPQPTPKAEPHAGAAVGYVLAEGAHKGETRDATITELFGTHMRLEVATEPGDGLPSPLLVYLAPYDAGKAAGTWH